MAAALRAVKGIDLKSRGKIVTSSAPNGAGKSTTPEGDCRTGQAEIG